MGCGPGGRQRLEKGQKCTTSYSQLLGPGLSGEVFRARTVPISVCFCYGQEKKAWCPFGVNRVKRCMYCQANRFLQH